jgi:hypothetical protein
MLIDDLAKEIIKYKTRLTDPFIHTLYGIDYDGEFSEQAKHTFGLIYTSTDTPEIIKTKTHVYALEVMRNIINQNRFDLLEEFYSNFLINNFDDTDCKTNTKVVDSCYKCSSHKSNIITPFEGYYINENIISLMGTLLENLKLSSDFIVDQPSLYFNNINKLSLRNSKNEDYSNNINTEIIAQTYFFRAFTRLYNIKTNFTTEYIGKERNVENPNEYLGKEIKSWINDTYDYNKAYMKKDPPISSILKPYFSIIKNFYVFYVVSNENEDKCDKQIKLISDSKDFLIELGNYKG